MQIHGALAASLLFFIAGVVSLRGSELIAPAPINEVSIRTTPAFTVIETDTIGSLDTAWTKGFHVGARYTALANAGLNTPTIMTFPDWEKTPSAEGSRVHVLVQCLLQPMPDYPRVRDHDGELRKMTSMTVACYAQQGAYSAASFQAGLKKIQDYLKARSIPSVGPPRYLYYSDSNWMPSWWRVGEVQVPIPSGIAPN